MQIDFLEVMMNFLGHSGHTGLGAVLCCTTGTNLGTALVLVLGHAGVGGGSNTSIMLGPSSSSESTLNTLGYTGL